MYGCQSAMDGNCLGMVRLLEKQSSPGRLLVCFLFSLGIHSLLLLLPVVQAVSVAAVSGAGTRSLPGRLQVFLVPQEREVVEQKVFKDMPTAAIVSGRSLQAAPKFPQGEGVSGVLPDKEPELVSEIDSEIDDPAARGFMILYLRIDEMGLVSAADVIYSGLPSGATDLIVQRFVSARFRPAVKNGKVAEVSTLLRIDID